MNIENLYNSKTNFFASSKETKLFKKNEKIYEENQKVESIFIILDGSVKSKSSISSKKKNITLLKGSTLGLIDAILERPFSRSMVANCTTSLAVICKKELQDVFNNNKYSSLLLKSLAIDIDNKYPDIWS